MAGRSQGETLAPTKERAMDPAAAAPPVSPHERMTPGPRTERLGSDASSHMSGTGRVGRTRSSRETAEPLAHALDATLSHLMDEKISNFGKAFKNMETRLNRQQTVLTELERRIDDEEAVARAENEQIAQKVASIHQLIDENVSEEELRVLKQRIGDMEHYVREEIEGKLEQIDSMHEVLEHFGNLGKKVEETKQVAKEKTDKAHEDTRKMLDAAKQKKQQEIQVRVLRPRPPRRALAVYRLIAVSVVPSARDLRATLINRVLVPFG